VNFNPRHGKLSSWAVSPSLFSLPCRWLLVLNFSLVGAASYFWELWLSPQHTLHISKHAHGLTFCAAYYKCVCVFLTLVRLAYSLRATQYGRIQFPGTIPFSALTFHPPGAGAGRTLGGEKGFPNIPAQRQSDLLPASKTLQPLVGSLRPSSHRDEAPAAQSPSPLPTSFQHADAVLTLPGVTSSFRQQSPLRQCHAGVPRN
jgi:hypothetical protein